MRGTCDNEEELFYCKECYIDDNEEFYKKYANLVITDDTLEQEQDFLIDLKEFSSKNYNLTYKCARCDNNTTFDEDIERGSDFRMVKVRTPKGWIWRKVKKEVDIERDAE